MVLTVPIKALTSSLFFFKQATSIHNTTDLVEHQVELVKALLQMTFDIGSPLIPFNVDQYANALHTWTESLVAFYNGTLRKQNITLGTETLQKSITQKSRATMTLVLNHGNCLYRLLAQAIPCAVYMAADKSEAL